MEADAGVRSRLPDHSFWLACVACGVAVLAACVLPLLRFFVANDLDSRLEYVVRPHDVVLARNPGETDAAALLIAGAALVAAGALGVARRARAILVVVAVAAALVGCIQADRALADWTGDPEGGFPYCTDERTTQPDECGTTIARLGADRTSVRPKKGIVYSDHPRAGVFLLVASSLPFALWAGFRLSLLLFRRRRLAAAVYAPLAALAVVFGLFYLVFAHAGYD